LLLRERALHVCRTRFAVVCPNARPRCRHPPEARRNANARAAPLAAMNARERREHQSRWWRIIHGRCIEVRDVLVIAEERAVFD